MNSISVESAGKRIGQAWVLRDINLEVSRGEVFGIFGRSGSGKSTLLHLIAGLCTSTIGTVHLQMDGEGDKSWLDARISIALQQPGLAPDLTVLENLSMFSSLWTAPRKGRMSRIAKFLELLGLAEVRNRRFRELPDGMRAAAEVARALVARAEITAIDGLIERLDRPTRRRLWEYVLSRKRQGETFIIATSSGEEAAFCDRLAVLSKGRLEFVGTPAKLASAVENEAVVVESIRNPVLKSKLKERFGAAITERNGSLEFRSSDGDAEIARILSEAPSDVGCIYLHKPTLEDALEMIEGD